ERVGPLLITLARHFDAVIVDGVRDFGDLALSALDIASRIVLTLTADVAAVRSAARCLEVFRELGYSDEKLFVVVNRHHRGAMVERQAVARRLGLPVQATIANDFRVVSRALDFGKVLAEAAPRARVTRDVERMIAGLRAPLGRRAQP